MKPRANRFFFPLAVIASFALATASPLSAKHRYTIRGERAFARANYERAIEYFNKALDAGETRGEPHFFIGSILENQRKFSDSISYFAAAVNRKMAFKYKKAAYWKLVLYFKKTKDYEQLIHYIDKMNSRGIRHPNLDKFRAEADASLTPEIREARKLLKEADALDKEFAKLRKALPKNSELAAKRRFWRQNSDQVEEIISKYEAAISLESAYEVYHWKIAFYYERLESHEKAVQSYGKLLVYLEKQIQTKGITKRLKRKLKHDLIKAHYKKGVLRRKLGQYSEAIATLKEALSLTKHKNRLQYYILTNLAQSYYGNSKFKAAAKTALRVVKLRDQKIKVAANTHMPQLLYCLAALHHGPYPSKAIKRKIWKKVCYQLVKRTKSKKIRESEKTTFFLLRGLYLGAKAPLMRSKKKRAKYRRSAAKFLSLALLDRKIKPAAQATKGKKYIEAIDTEELKKLKDNPILRNWQLVEAEPVCLFLKQENFHTKLYYAAQVYHEHIKKPMYYYAFGAFSIGKFERVVEAIDRIDTLDTIDKANKSYDLAPIHLKSLANLEKFSQVSEKFNSYTNDDSQKKETLLSMIKRDESFAGFRLSQYYELIVAKN